MVRRSIFVLANRRLQPLGHLTARGLVSIRQAFELRGAYRSCSATATRTARPRRNTVFRAELARTYRVALQCSLRRERGVQYTYSVARTATPRHTDRIIVKSILNRVRAWTACG